MKSIRPIFVVLALSLTVANFGFIGASSTASLNTSLATVSNPSIQNIIANLKALNASKGSIANTGSILAITTFTRSLKQGSVGTDVKNLQILLNQDPTTRVATTGSGSPGHETTYYGPATSRAVSKFQLKYKSEILTPNRLVNPTGMVGVATLRKLNSLIASNKSVGNTPIVNVSNQVNATTTVTLIATSTTPVGVFGTCGTQGSNYATGQPVSWVASVGGGTGTYSFSWTGSDSFYSTAQNPSMTYQTAGTKNTSLTVSSGNQQVTINCQSVVVADANSIPPLTQTAPTNDPVISALMNKLHPDGSADDGPTIQAMVDAANAQGLTSITFPAGHFRLDHKAINFYGSNITFSGQGDSTQFIVNTHYNGVGDDGSMMLITGTVDLTPYNPTQILNNNTLVFSGSVPFQAGDNILLENGNGSTRAIEHALGGGLDVPNIFKEAAPSETATVASVSNDGAGNTTVTLQSQLIGVGEYNNFLPAGTAPSRDYLTALRVTRKAENLTVKNLSISFTDMSADSALFMGYADHINLTNIHVLNKTNAGGMGVIASTGLTYGNFTNITSPASIGLNSSRFVTISQSRVSAVALEESSTDDVIQNNVLGDGTNIAVRTGDLGCRRISILNNDVTGGTVNQGGIGIWEGQNITVVGNHVHDNEASIWIGLSPGLVVHDNTAPIFKNFDLINTAQVYSNSWQATSWISKSLNIAAVSGTIENLLNFIRSIVAH